MPSSPKVANGFPTICMKPSPELIEAPQSTQTTPTMPMEMKLIIIMFSAALARVMPP